MYDLTKADMFVHAIDPGDERAFYPCLNLAAGVGLFSPDYIALKEPALGLVHNSLRNRPADSLLSLPFPAGALSPAAVYLLLAAEHLNGTILTYGDGTLLDAGTLEYAVLRSEVEVEFERGRRLIDTSLPSRLSCIWVAANEPDAKRMVKNMLGSNVYFLDVRIADCISMLRADASHWELFFADRDSRHIEEYWRGESCSAQPKWEFLLDGLLMPTKREQVAALCRKHLESGAPPWNEMNLPPDGLIALAREGGYRGVQ